MSQNRSAAWGKWLMTLGTAIYTFIPPIVDILTPTHIFHPDWVAHARFHTMWAIISTSAIGMLALWCLWRSPPGQRPGVMIAGAIGTIVLGSFMIAAIAMPLYGGALSDPDGVPPLASGIDANLVTFAAALVMVLTGWRLALNSEQD